MLLQITEKNAYRGENENNILLYAYYLFLTYIIAILSVECVDEYITY